jgi:ABC-type transporter Mla MlaB component
VHRDAGGTVLCMTGEIDAAVVAAYEDEHGAQPEAIDAVDAGTVSYISSKGVAFLLQWADAAPGAPVLRHSSRQLDRMLQLSGLGAVFQRPSGT